MIHHFTLKFINMTGEKKKVVPVKIFPTMGNKIMCKVKIPPDLEAGQFKVFLHPITDFGRKLSFDLNNICVDMGSFLAGSTERFTVDLIKLSWSTKFKIIFLNLFGRNKNEIRS